MCSVVRADTEPNAHVYDAEPLTGAGPWSGSITTGETDAQDMYVFYVQGPAQIQLTFTRTSGSCFDAQLQNDDNSDRVDPESPANGEPEQATINAPAGISRWRLIVYSYAANVYVPYPYVSPCKGGPDDYRFAIDPVGGQLATGPVFSPGRPTNALAETADQAFGPLVAGTTYKGTIVSEEDNDWLYFITTPGAHQVQVSVANPDNADLADRENSGGCDVWWTVDNHNVDDEDEDPPFADGNRIEADTANLVTFTSPAKPTRYDIQMYGDCPSAEWIAQVDGAGAVSQDTSLLPVSAGGTGPEPPGGGSDTSGPGAGPKACASARKALKAAARRRARARHALLTGPTRASRHAAAVKLRKARRAHRKALRRVRAACRQRPGG